MYLLFFVATTTTQNPVFEHNHHHPIEQVSVWHIDDVSMTQGNGELINNGGFEMSFTGWVVSSSANLSITPLAYSSPPATHTGSIYLYSTALSTPDKIK
ncbi:unnamed protein product [Adineta steineri]|uniref:Uncharacterized protein n=1 Tax=Adineta steineri TaxID=433720 RepID=A0A813MF40_9BILA|nr:unnamed protein product [Adineta steineri]